MLSKPLETFAALAQFLRIGASRRRLHRAIEASSFERLREQERRSGFKEKPETAETFFREGRSGQWRETLCAEQVQAVVRANAEMMQRFGYLPAESR